MLNKLFIFIVFLILTYGCSNQIIIHNDNLSNRNGKTEIMKDYRFDTIKITNTLTNNPVMSQIYNNNDSIEYIMWDHNNLYFFKYKTGKLLRKKRLNKQCGKLNSFSGFMVHSLDSIFVYNYWAGSLWLLDSTSTITNKWTIVQEKNYKYPLYPRTIRYSPIIYNLNHIILSGSNYGHTVGAEAKDNPVSLKLNLENNTITPISSYPEHYRKANFGGEHCKLIYHTLGREQSIVYSFPMDNYLYRYSDKSDSLQRIYAGSKYIQSIKSSDLPYSKMKKDNKKGIQYYVSQSTYANIIYDKYRNLYYRVAEHPIKDWKINSRTFIKPFSIIILDQNFNIIGESEVIDNGSYNRDNLHCTPEGLIIQKYDSNEDIIIFSLFKLQKK